LVPIRPYGEAPPKRGTFFRLQIYERLVGNLLFWSVKGTTGIGDAFCGCEKVEKTF